MIGTPAGDGHAQRPAQNRLDRKQRSVALSAMSRNEPLAAVSRAARAAEACSRFGQLGGEPSACGGVPAPWRVMAAGRPI